MTETFPEKKLEIYADGEPVETRVRVMLRSEERIGLLPWQSVLRFANLPEEEELALSRCRQIECRTEGKLLCFGRNAEVFRRTAGHGTVTTVIFSSGLPLWEARISLSVEAGTSVSETLRLILAASGTGISLVSFPGRDPFFPRAQAFFGRAAECLEETLSAAGARGYLTPSGLCAVPTEGLPVSMVLGEEDLIGLPEFTRDGNMVLRTREAGWTVGKFAEVRWGSQSVTGMIRETLQEIDTGKDAFHTEILLEVNHGRS